MRQLHLVCIGSAFLAFGPHLALAATTYHVATTGSDSGAGSESAPFGSVNKANSVAAAGDTIYIHGGTYKITSGTNSCSSQTDTVNAISLSKSGASGNLIKYWAAPGETPIFDYSELMADCRVKGFLVSGNYIHMKGIEVTGVKQRNQSNHESWGVWISGSNNIFELLNIHHIDGTGLFIGKGGGNLVLNSDSHHNFDPLTSNGACESGDGFGAHIPAGGTGNIFRGCRAWFNSDDDFDLINAFESVTIENCWAWHAGYRYDTGAGCGNGNGIKAGGYGTDTSTFPASPPVHVIRGNLAVGNRAAGFYANHHPGKITFYNNTSYGNNPDFNMLGMSNSGADITVGTYRNNLAVGSKLTSNAKSPDDAMNSWTLSVTASDADFVSVSETGLDSPRNADGSLPEITNFHLVASSDLVDKGEDVGLPFSGSKPDLGCFETGLTTSAGGTTAAGGAASAGNASALGGSKATGGAATAGANSTRGGAATAGNKAIGGASTVNSSTASSLARGGAPVGAAGRSNGGSSVPTVVAGQSASAPVNPNSSGGIANVSTSGNTDLPIVYGGAATTGGPTIQGGAATNVLSSSSTRVSGASGNGGKVATNAASTATPATGSSAAPDSGGCSCRLAGRNARNGSATLCTLFGMIILRKRRRRDTTGQ